MPRATVSDVRFSRFSQVIGKCANDIAAILPVLNEATQRLLQASGETGWFGCWEKVAFNVSVANPYITLPRQFARAINLDVCRFPVRMRNEFYEFLPGGIGLQTPCSDWCGNIAGYERGEVPSMVDMDGAADNFIRVYLSNSADAGKRVLITGTDANDLQIYSIDGSNNVNGTFLTLTIPFATTSFYIKTIQALQKDVTFGDVIVKQVNGVTGVETLLSRLAPTEINPAYRRFYISKLPSGCCPSNTGHVTVTALCKLQYVPVYQDTDQLIIANIPALIEEAQAIRYSSMDIPNAALLEQKHHNKAIRLLQNEQRHELGNQMSVVCDPFYGASLQSQMIGSLT